VSRSSDLEAPLDLDGQLAELRSRICNTTLVALSPLGTPTLIASLSRMPEFGLTPVMSVQTVALILLLWVTFKRTRLGYAARAITLLSIFYLLAVAGLWSFGHLGGGKLMLLVFIVLTAMFTEKIYAYLAILISALTLALFGWAYVTQSVDMLVQSDTYHRSMRTWLTAILTTVLLGGFIASALAKLLDFQRALLSSLEDEARYNSALIQQAAAFLFVVDNQLAVQDWNANTGSLFVKDRISAEDKSLGAWLVPCIGNEKLSASVQAALQGKYVNNLEVKAENSEGQRLDVIWNITPHVNTNGEVIGVISVGQDVTELKQVQGQALHNARLRTLGGMTTSIAHEINQPLAAIRLLASNILKRCSLALDKKEALDVEFIDSKVQRIQQQIERAAVITDHMRLFGHTSNDVWSTFSLQTVIDGVLSLTGEQFRLQDIQLCYVKPDEDLLIQGNPLELEQAILSILDNAQYAVNSSSSHNKRTVEIALLQTPDSHQIRISDSGPGINEAHLPHIFEPFFTTKETGEGTGLGLSVTYQVISSMDATLTAHNGEQCGAIFTISFSKVTSELTPSSDL